MATHMEFMVLKDAVAKQYARMQKLGKLFRTDVTGDEVYAMYLASFPAGTNPIYRERTEHDCSCCNNFIRAVGNVVAVIDGELESVWDIVMPSEPNYQAVADALSRLVHNKPIANVFLHHSRMAGVDQSIEDLTALMRSGASKGPIKEGSPTTKTWRHLFANIDAKYVKPEDDIPSLMAVPRDAAQVFRRGLDTITLDSIETVLDLIAQNTLLRGEEFQENIKKFRDIKKVYDSKDRSEPNKQIFSWVGSADLHGSISGIRNTSIGTLLVALSEGMELEEAVKAFETKVGGANYKRPTALVTPQMIAKAEVTVKELGLESALPRRYAVLSDITVNNVLFANRSTRKALGASVFEELAAQTPGKKQDFERVEEIHIDKFMTDVLPRVETIEVYLENKHSGRMVSLIAPQDPTAGQLFKWTNNFSWSYAGELADSIIKERVKAAGGNVVGDLCCRLAWSNHDDLDFHMIEPDGNHLYFANRYETTRCGGRLDVDMNAGSGQSRTPVENIFYADRRTMKEGVYHLFVNQFNQRERADVGFEVEIDYLGDVRKFAHPKAVPNKANITVAKFRYTHKGGIDFVESLESTQPTKNVWGLQTGQFHQVNALLKSPNHWDDQIGTGNRHWFFMLEGCKNDATARGFYNEFLPDTLSKHRKVFEVLGAKMRVPDSDSQLSGVGFSSTQKDSVVLRVSGRFNRVLRVVL